MSEQLYRWVKASQRMPDKKWFGPSRYEGNCYESGNYLVVEGLVEDKCSDIEWLEPLPLNADVEQDPRLFVAENEKEMKRLYDWIMDENRRKAGSFFTGGWTRNVAREIEYRIASRPSIDIVDELRKMNPYSTNYQEVGFHTGYDAAVVRLQELLNKSK